MQNILVINAGSSSLKYELVDKETLEIIAKGLCEKIGIAGTFKINFNNKQDIVEHKFFNIKEALDFLLKYLIEKNIIKSKDDVVGVGNRIVHGGTIITESCIVDDNVIKVIENYTDLAPLHIPPELEALKSLQKIFDKAKHVAVFDTSFHTTIPKINYMYGVKKEWLENYEIRKFGFHGISYHYINEKMKEILNKDKLNLIVCHLGSGSSLCAIKESKSISTSMGFSAIDGLIMCTRTGDISPAVFDYLSKKMNKTVNEIFNICSKESGLKGLTTYTDMRDVEAHLNEKDVKTGFDVFIKRIVNYIAISLNDVDNKIDAIVFCGGIGENSSIVRQAIINGIKLRNIKLDPKLNEQAKNQEYLKISSDDSDINVFVVKTNEEKMIASEVKRLIK